MSNEEAIEILQSGAGVWPMTGRANNAINTAIKALSQQTEDAISRQAMLDGLASIAKAKAKSDAPKSLMGRVMFFTERLSSVNPQEPKTGWVPVSERLPKEYGEYLITWTTSLSKRPFIGISEGEITSEYDHEHNRFKFEWLLDDYVKNYPDVEVIAWMPLPELYKAGSEEA